MSKRKSPCPTTSQDLSSSNRSKNARIGGATTNVSEVIADRLEAEAERVMRKALKFMAEAKKEASRLKKWAKQLRNQNKY